MFRKTAFNIYHNYLKRDELYKFTALFDKTQYWSKEEILKYQWDLFKKQLNYAYEKAPYYKNIFDKLQLSVDDIKSTQDLIKIPILTKDIVRSNFNDLVAKDIDKSRIKWNSTSGSTGSNFKFLSDKGTLVPSALQHRCYSWMGIDFFDKKMSVWGAGWDVKKSKKLISRIKSAIKGATVLSGYNLSDKDLTDYFKLMDKINPRLIISYPSILFDMAKFFEKNELTFSPKAIQIGGEKLFPFQRDYIEKIFKAPVFDFYGARDMSMIAQDCDKHEGLHIMAENVLVEVLDDEGYPVEEGEGDLVITNLHNKVMPFIRYKIGDRAVVTQKQCSCGRGLPLLKEIIGRSFEIIEFPNGNKVGGTFWTILLRTEPGIQKLQVVQKAKDLIQINYVPEKENGVIIFKNFIDKIHHYSGQDLNVKFNKVSEIPPTKGGKYRFIVKEIE